MDPPGYEEAHATSWPMPTRCRFPRSVSGARCSRTRTRDHDYAGATRHGGIGGPPTMVVAWCM
jgi:hypothetical protein